MSLREQNCVCWLSVGLKTAKHIQLYIQTERCHGFADRHIFVCASKHQDTYICTYKQNAVLDLQSLATAQASHLGTSSCMVHLPMAHLGRRGGGLGGVGWGGGMCEMLEGGGRECWFVGLLGTVCDPSSQCEVSSHVRFEPQPK